MRPALFPNPVHAQRKTAWRKGWRWFGAGLLFGCIVGTAWTADDDEKDEVPTELQELRQKLSSVKEWQGVWEVSNGGAVMLDRPPGGFLNSRYEEKTHGSFLLKRNMRNWTPRRGILSWQGEGEASGSGQGVFSERESGLRRNGADWESYYQGTMLQREITFEVWFGGKSRLVSLHPGSWDEKGLPRITRTGRTLSQPSLSDPVQEFKIDENHPKPVMVWYLGSGKETTDRNWAVVSGGATVLEFVHDDAGGWPGVQSFGEQKDVVRKRSRVLLFPVYDNLEVEVTIDGYDEWRPQGSVADPKQPGNNLLAHATLKNKDGSPGTDLPPVRRFIFELKETSREPGVCLNWPLHAKDNDPDLRLTGAAMGGDLSNEDQKLVVKVVPKDAQQQPYAEAKVDSYDFGGRAELRVTCELEDGREIVGLLKNDQGGVDLVRIPKTNGPGWIAEIWRQQHGVTDLQDNDDDEKVDGQDYKGDGFTLYEEYRGFVENGVHIEGDPKKKDFFILNLADVSTRNGISLLERLAKLRVHARLRRDREMETEARLMNGNHRAAPHRVDQHGVTLAHEIDLQNSSFAGGGVQVPRPGVDSNKAARPRDTAWCYIVQPDAINGIFSAETLKRYGLSHLSVSELYAAAVAHELLHAIGVDHHGDKLFEVLWGEFQAADNPKNSAHKARFVNEGATTTLTLLWEDTQANIADEQQALFNEYLAHTTFSREAAEYLCNYRIFAGQARGTDSGDETCVMRYYFATASKARGKGNTFYVIRPGAKQPETTLCTSPKGTGGNAASHQPQSRFGDAAGGRGDCFGYVCPNDAIPTRSTIIK